jgi:carbon-monoxide dehydrogenase medium subunit
MVNTHILFEEFEYLEPKTVEEALDYLAAYGEKAKVIAGGTDLLVQMKMGKVQPGCLINISRIPALRYLIEERGLRIGSLTTFRDLERSQVIKDKYTALFEAARSVSSVQIKTMGTVGGNLCNASPAADTSPPLIAFGAKVKLAEKDRENILRLDEFFIGPGEALLSPTEILLEVQVPEVIGNVGSAFLKVGRVSADMAKVSCAVTVEREDNLCRSCRIALGSVAERPIRALKAEEMITAESFKEDLAEKVAQKACEEIRPITDVRSTAQYRKEISRILVREAILIAWRRAEIRHSKSKCHLNVKV